MTRIINQKPQAADPDLVRGKKALGVLREAVAEALDRKRRLGQYWVVWDGEKPVEVHPETETRPAAE